MRPSIAALVLIVLVACSPTAETTQDTRVTLPSDCRNQVVEPQEVLLTCGNQGIYASNLTWSDWGQVKATADGIASVLRCDPSCVEGRRIEYPVRLTADRIRDCSGKDQYTRISYVYPEDSPFPDDAPGSRGYVTFDCPDQTARVPRNEFISASD